MSTGSMLAEVAPVETLPPVLQITGLNHWFGQGETRQEALININMEINPGEIVLLLGPSGCGKTTLLTLIGGLRTVQQGSVRVLGEEMAGLLPKQLVRMRGRIGFIFQMHNLFSSLTALQNVMLALELHEPDVEARRKRAREMLKRLDMSQRETYRPEKLSGGQRQRVAIARALATRPKLILADEPTAALDAGAADLVVKEFKRLAKTDNPEDRSTILVVTHDEKIEGMADRIITMREKKIESNVLWIDIERIVHALQQNDLFRRLNPKTLRTIAGRMGLQSINAGETLFRQDDYGDRFFLVCRGLVEILVEPPGEAPIRLALGPGKVFGEKGLLAADRRRRGSARALQDTDLYYLNEQSFRAVLAESPFLVQELKDMYPETHEPQEG